MIEAQDRWRPQSRQAVKRAEASLPNCAGGHLCMVGSRGIPAALSAAKFDAGVLSYFPGMIPRSGAYFVRSVRKFPCRPKQ